MLQLSIQIDTIYENVWLMRIKICGITKPEQGVAIARMGATALGFICVPASARYVTAVQIRAAIARLDPGLVDRIGVFANSTSEEICQVFQDAGLTGVQLHGDESPKDCDRLRGLLPDGTEIIKAIRVRTTADLDRASSYINCVDTLLLDAYHPGMLGGTGKQLDWGSLQQFKPGCPWLLAGGLTPDNIMEALTQVKPSGIDLSSGVERSPGDKDLTKVAQLFATIEDEVSI